MNALSGLALGMTTTFSSLSSVLILLVGGIMALGLAIYLFDWDARNTQHPRSRYLALLALAPYVIGALLLR